MVGKTDVSRVTPLGTQITANSVCETAKSFERDAMYEKSGLPFYNFTCIPLLQGRLEFYVKLITSKKNQVVLLDL